MKKKNTYAALIILSLLPFIGCNDQNKSANRPNILYIVVDEMREMAMSCSGNPNIKTAGLDSLAAQGMRFTRMFTPNPVCSPARASIHTGLFPHNAGMPHNNYHLRETAPTLAEVLSGSGYKTGLIGKWHLDGEESKYTKEDKESFNQQKKSWGDGYYGFVPPESHRGFQYWAGYEHGHQYFSSRYWGNEHKAIDLPEGVYEPDFQTELAIQFIKKNREKSWFLNLNYGTPHFPYEEENVKSEDLALFNPANIKLRPNVPVEFESQARDLSSIYYAMIYDLDQNIQKIIDALKEQHLFENTLIIFTADHGEMMLSHGQHYKRRPQEESSRIPFIVSYPAKVKKGAVANQYLTLVDVFPTILDILNVKAPPNEGRSFMNILTGKSNEEINESIYLGCAQFGCRDYDPGLFARKPWRAIRTKDYMMAFLKTDQTMIQAVQLFDMNKDPYEMNNLIKDTAFIDVKRELTSQFDYWRKRTGDSEFERVELPKW